MRRELRERIIDNILDFIIYASCISVIMWGILKGLGIINTPALIQYFPIISGGIAVLGIAFRMGRFVEHVALKFAHHDKEFEKINNEFEKISACLNNLEYQTRHLDHDVEQLKTDVAFVKQRV